MAIVERVPKNGFNKFHSYNYATEADIAQAVRQGLAERKVMMFPYVETERTEDLATKNGMHKLCTLGVRFDLHDADSDEVLSIRVTGQGSDAGDKAGYKAMTGAVKYALMKLFLIPTGDDPENEQHDNREPPPPQGLEGVRATMSTPPPRLSVSAGAVFPNYGKAKGQPIHGASQTDLEYYLNGAKRTLADPGKARFHETEAKLVAAIEAELARGGA
jgi:hypothetical protein